MRHNNISQPFYFRRHWSLVLDLLTRGALCPLTPTSCSIDVVRADSLVVIACGYGNRPVFTQLPPVERVLFHLSETPLGIEN